MCRLVVFCRLKTNKWRLSLLQRIGSVNTVGNLQIAHNHGIVRHAHSCLPCASYHWSLVPLDNVQTAISSEPTVGRKEVPTQSLPHSSSKKEGGREEHGARANLFEVTQSLQSRDCKQAPNSDSGLGGGAQIENKPTSEPHACFSQSRDC